MIPVILHYRTGVQHKVLLAGVPRVGEQIRLRHISPDEEALVVDAVIWVEGGNGSPEPQVIALVHEHD